MSNGGVKFSEIKIEIRRAYVVKILSCSEHITVDQLARELGYTERSTLAKFVMSEFGLTLQELHALVAGKNFVFEYTFEPYKYALLDIIAVRDSLIKTKNKPFSKTLPKSLLRNFKLCVDGLNLLIRELE